MKHRCTPSQVPQLTERLVFRMHLLMLASLLPAAMAEFDQCARASGTWVGFDQVTPLSTCAMITCPSLFPPTHLCAIAVLRNPRALVQGLGSSRAQAVTHSGNNVYVGGYAYASPSPR